MYARVYINAYIPFIEAQQLADFVCQIQITWARASLEIRLQNGRYLYERGRPPRQISD